MSVSGANEIYGMPINFSDSQDLFKMYLYILDPCIAWLINAQKLKHTKIAFLGIVITTFLEYVKIFIEMWLFQ